jgi:hypothetical protein
MSSAVDSSVLRSGVDQQAERELLNRFRKSILAIETESHTHILSGSISLHHPRTLVAEESTRDGSQFFGKRACGL